MVADAVVEPEPGGLTLAKVFDLTGLVLLVAIVVDAVGSIVSAITLPEIGGTAGIINSAVGTFDRLTTGAGWAAGAFVGVLLLLAIGVVVLPRIILEAEMEPEWPERARRLVIATAAISVLSVAANGVTIFTTLAHPGLPSSLISSSQQARVVGQAASGLVLQILATALAWAAWPHAVSPFDPGPERSEPADPYGADAAEG